MEWSSDYSVIIEVWMTGADTHDVCGPSWCLEVWPSTVQVNEDEWDEAQDHAQIEEPPMAGIG